MNLSFQRITSLRNPSLRQAVRLRQRRGRDQQTRILIDGQREISLAQAAGVSLDEVFFDESWLADDALRRWLAECQQAGARLTAVPPTLLAKIGYGTRHDQCVATAASPMRRLADFQLPPDPLIVVLEGIEKPGNLGAVVRTADAVGANAVIVSDGRTDLFNPNAIRASRGTIFTMPVCSAPLAELSDWLDRQSLAVYVARLDADRLYDACDLRGGTALVLGSETEGVSPHWRSTAYHGIRLPMAGHADSLNVAATAAVLLYEAHRQRHAPAG